MTWTKKEDDMLKAFYEERMGIPDIAEKLGKTPSAVRNRAYRLKITKSPAFTEAELEYIRANYNSYNLQEIADKLNRPKTSVCRIAKEIGIERTGRKKENPTGSYDENGVWHKNGWRRKTEEEIAEKRSEIMKEWYKTHEHPRGMKGKHHSEEYREQLSRQAKEFWVKATPEQLKERYDKQIATKIKNGTLNPSAFQTNPYSRTKSGKRADLGGQFFRSAWEANIARLFNAMGVKWEYEPKTFYFPKIRRGCVSYTPDFYLPDYNVWVEVKGWMDDRSKTKLKRFAKYYPEEKLELIDQQRYKRIEKTAKVLPNWE